MGTNVLLGEQFIISLFGAIPVIGDDLTLWIRGDTEYPELRLTVSLPACYRIAYRVVVTYRITCTRLT